MRDVLSAHGLVSDDGGLSKKDMLSDDGVALRGCLAQLEKHAPR